MRSKNIESLYNRAPRLNQLNILNQTAADPHLTQSELARRCGLSVAMVNNYMKDLCSAGLLEYRRKSSKSVSYHVTNEGRKAADAIESAHFDELVKLFAAGKERIRRVILSRAGDHIHRAVVYGSGDLAELVFHALESADVSIVGVCDPDPSRIGREWCGREILSPSQIKFIAPDAVVITVPDSERTGQLFTLVDRGIHLIRLDDVGASELPRSKNGWDGEEAEIERAQSAP
jgi:predicted transcriptional regulator